MSFAVEIRHWSSVELFAASLTGPAPAWVEGLSPYHTLVPRVNQWRGLASVEGLRDYYTGKGWSAGPHLFFCAGAPNPQHDRIWQLTPLSTSGIHAGVCNEDHWGLEIVGDYDQTPWPMPVANLFYDTAAVLLRWRGLAVTAQSVRRHRECLPNKTCPGAAIDMNLVRAELARRIAPTALAAITADSPILAPARCTQAAAFILARPHSQYTSADIRLSIFPAYFEVCGCVGLDPCLAIAQMIHETGNLSSFWSARPQRNPAGIGVTGQVAKVKPKSVTGWAWNDARRRWEYGVSFPSWASHAIPAHVGRLVAYATAPAARTSAQQQLMREALAYRALPASYYGAAPTLRGLQERWAVPGHGYAARIAAIADLIRTTEA
jgi:hypothetical protein